MSAAVARVEVMLPTWSARPALTLPTLPSLRLPRVAGVWQRARRHVLVAALSLLAGIVLWLPGGFGLSLAIRMVIGVVTGLGIATITTAISLTLPR
jgi:hypothetical protein